tara:strand:- start:195 stop:386 length:192 start_codon:yes stop_codon:yes gene_type:complete
MITNNHENSEFPKERDVLAWSRSSLAGKIGATSPGHMIGSTVFSEKQSHGSLGNRGLKSSTLV